MNKDMMLPYEKSEVYGLESLTDTELLAIIIRSGTKGCDCIQAAKNVLDASGNIGIIGLYDLSVKDLCKLEGIGKVKAVQLKSICELSRRISNGNHPSLPVFSSVRDVTDYLMEDMRHEKKETLRLLMLDTKGQLKADKLMSIGTVNSTIMSPRDISREALLSDCTGVIIAHNHPSGDPTPSEGDIISTKRLCEALNIMGITLIDHVIIGDNRYVSMKNEKII